MDAPVGFEVTGSSQRLSPLIVPNLMWIARAAVTFPGNSVVIESDPTSWLVTTWVAPDDSRGVSGYFSGMGAVLSNLKSLLKTGHVLPDTHWLMLSN